MPSPMRASNVRGADDARAKVSSRASRVTGSRLASARVLSYLMLAVAVVTAPAFAQTSAPRSLVVLDFDLIDDQVETVPDLTLGPRMASIRDQLAAALVREHLYKVVDNGPASELIARLKATQDLHACNGCEFEIAKKLGVDRVLVGWVQKVSNLILNINIRIENADDGTVILRKSVDLRGNTDESWRRGIEYMVRDMVEKHQGSR